MKPMQNNTVYAIITARGGSKGLPRKNILPLAGKPLIAHTIEAALGCPTISRCFVSTDDREIKSVALEWNAEVIDRPAALATDTATSQDVMRHALETLRAAGEMPAQFALLQPTSPLRTSRHIAECIELFFRTGRTCCASATETDHHPYKSFRVENDRIIPLASFEHMSTPRQTLPVFYRPNGAIYVVSSERFLRENTFITADTAVYVMGRGDSIDIDNSLDLLICEHILSSWR